MSLVMAEQLELQNLGRGRAGRFKTINVCATLQPWQRAVAPIGVREASVPARPILLFGSSRRSPVYCGGEALTATVVLGLAWGDEGKGRVCDALASDVRYVSRYSGGNNAGHTIRIGKEEFVVHLIPSGIVREGVVCTVGKDRKST